MFPSSEIPDQLWSPKGVLIKEHQKIFHSVKQTGCEFGHKSAYCPGEELVKPFHHYSSLRDVQRLFTFTVSLQSSGEKERRTRRT